jgi:hypothetical protein
MHYLVISHYALEIHFVGMLLLIAVLVWALRILLQTDVPSGGQPKRIADQRDNATGNANFTRRVILIHCSLH